MQFKRLSSLFLWRELLKLQIGDIILRVWYGDEVVIIEVQPKMCDINTFDYLQWHWRLRVNVLGLF